MLKEALLLLLGVSIYKATKFISHSLNGNQPVVVNDSSKDDLILSQTVSPPATNYDVFLSFRGEDTRHTFASYLYKGLCNAGIHTFMDHELHKGEQISSALLRAIQESEISMIIFSENYASSTWCMDELVHILECKKKFGRIVIPIFYNVNPSNIRKQNGSFGKGFNVLKRRSKDNQEKLQKWRDALIQPASLSGWDSNSTSCARPEFKLIEEIVKDALSKLNYYSSYHLEGLVGIARHIKNIEKLLSEAHIVGIWGMGGAGKTTLAKVVFQVLRAQFDAFSLIENVKEKLKRISLDELQLNCLKELLKDKDISIYDIKSTFVKERLGRKKILLILDDVDDAIIAEDLTKVFDWFGEGSRIIITSRDKRVLMNASAYSIYHVLDLDFHGSIHLFSLKAFKQHEPSQGYMELSKSVVEYCQGNPLALVVLGCFLYGKGKEEWKSALDKLNAALHDRIIDVLKLSFEGLDVKQQNMFLDLAFLIKEGVDISLNLRRQLYDSSAYSEISVLIEKSLISVNHLDCIVMHGLVRKMGLEIAREQLFSRTKTTIRLWRHEDIDYFFSCGKEIEAIRCMSLDTSKTKRIELSASSFQKMDNLIFLKVYKSDRRKPSMLIIRGVFNYLPEELRFFSWEECPLPYVPICFCAKNIITLKMCNSNIRQLWNGNQHFPNLKEIDLSYSKYLIALPDLSHTPKIKKVNLDGCVSLAQIHSSTFQWEAVNLQVNDNGPKQINLGGSIKGTNSGLVIGYNYLDFHKLSLHKVTVKVFVCGKNPSGVRFKHVVVPFEEIGELRTGIQSMVSLLPFVREVVLWESEIKFGDDFNQHYDYYCKDNYHYQGIGVPLIRGFSRDMKDEEEEDELMEYCSSDSATEEEDEIMEYCSSNTTNTLTRHPNSITRWSLLRHLRLKERDIIGNAGCNVAQVSILKSLSSLSHDDDYRRRIKPLLDVKLSFLNIPPSASRDPWNAFRIHYNLDANQRRRFTFPGRFYFDCLFDQFPDTLIVVCSGFRTLGLKTLIRRKRS